MTSIPSFEAPSPPEAGAWLKLVADQMPAIMWTTDRELRFTSGVGAGLTGLNLQPGQLDGVSLYQFFGTRDAQFSAIAAHRRALTGQRASIEQRWGGQIYEAHIDPLRDDAGEIVGCIGAALDVTARQQAQERLADVSNQLTDLARNLPGMLYQTRGKRDGTSFLVPYISAEAETFTGYKPAEIYAQPHLLLESIHPDDRGRYYDAALESMATLKPFRIEMRIVSRTGQVRWMQASSVGREIGDDELLYNGIAIDITESRKVAEELESTKAMLANVVHSQVRELERSKSSLTEYERKGSETERQLRKSSEMLNRAEELGKMGSFEWDISNSRVYWSEEMHRINCIPPEEFEGTVESAIRNVHPDDMPAVERAIRLSVKLNEPQPLDYRILCPNGDVRYVRARAFLFTDDDGQAQRMIGMCQDVTEQHEAERRLKSEQDLLRRLLDVREQERQLISYEIHDGFIQDVVGARMMLQALLHKLRKEAPHYADRLGEVEGLLSKALLEGRRLVSDLKPQVADDRGLVASLELLAGSGSTPEFEICLEHDVQFEHLPELLESGLLRIVQEAVTNARRHSGGSHVAIRLTQHDDRLHLEIEDDGQGFRMDDIPADHFGVRGIQERARLFDGKARFHTSPGEGTLIVVDLPLGQVGGWQVDGR